MIGLIRQNGIVGSLIFLLENRFGLTLPISSEARWKAAWTSELRFWDSFFEPDGPWAEERERRLRPDSEVADDLKPLLEGRDSLDVLDVGAGPLSAVGKRFEGRRLNLRAVDPLARAYDRLLADHGIEPPVRTEELAAEELTTRLPANHFDLVFAQNCIDHAIDPVRSILQMVEVTKPGGHVYMKHSQNEAVKEDWYGMHQWNLAEENGDFIISSRTDRTNFSKDYAHLGEMECTVDPELDYVHLKIRKRA